MSCCQKSSATPLPRCPPPLAAHPLKDVFLCTTISDPAVFESLHARLLQPTFMCPCLHLLFQRPNSLEFQSALRAVPANLDEVTFFFFFLHVTGEVAELFLVRRFRILGLKTDVHLWNKSVSIWTVTFFFLLLGLCSPPALVIVHLSSPAPFSLFCPGGFPKDHKQHSDF